MDTPIASPPGPGWILNPDKQIILNTNQFLKMPITPVVDIIFVGTILEVCLIGVYTQAINRRD